jgi:tetratricopeptide (TPR) repeat protein
MNQQSSSPMLSRWTAIFREEGDVQTADAIDRQLACAAERALDEDDAESLSLFVARAKKYDGRGDYEAAADSFAEVLRIVDCALGPSHPQVVEHLSNVARCQLNAGFYEEALAGYSRLLRLVQDLYGSDDGLAATARYYIVFCQRCIRDVVGSMRLQAHMNDMLRQSQGQLAVAASARVDRMRGIALRLVARGRLAAAIRLHEAAIALRLSCAQPDEEAAFLDIHRYAMDLRDAGEPGRAAAVLTKLVAMRNRKSAWIDQGQQLGEALMDAAACLSAQGQQRSAQEALALADLIAKRRQDGGATEPA